MSNDGNIPRTVEATAEIACELADVAVTVIRKRLEPAKSQRDGNPEAGIKVKIEGGDYAHLATRIVLKISHGLDMLHLVVSYSRKRI